VPEHLNFFSKMGLSKLLERTGFEVVDYIPVSRIPYYALSNRLRLKGYARMIVNKLIRFGQYVPLSILNFIGLGMSHNIWARRK
jgi:hypothetical protein